jgi:predicted phosphoribosyltransferase
MFLDRTEAGKQLAEALSSYKGQPVVVYALPRGGVVLGVEVARALHAPLDLIIVRKIGHPLSPEYAIGAVTAEGDIVTNPEETSTLDPEWLGAESARQLKEAIRRRDLFLRGREPADVRNKIAILVDDGIATGLTTEAAIRQLRKRSPAQIVLAAPVAAPETTLKLRPLVDDMVFLLVPRGVFGAIGAFYENFEQVPDSDVVAMMKVQLHENR